MAKGMLHNGYDSWKADLDDDVLTFDAASLAASHVKGMILKDEQRIYLLYLYTCMAESISV